MTTTPTGSADLTALPVGDYRIDGDRSTITFDTRHLFGLGAVHGSFRLRDGAVHVGTRPEESWARTRVVAATVETGNPSRDAAVRSDRLFAATTHPDIAFASTELDRVEACWVLRGLLTVRGTTHPVAVELGSAQRDTGLRIRAEARLDRYAFGVTGYRRLAGRHLRLRLDVAAQRER